MSFLGLGGKATGPASAVSKSKIESAEAEIDTVADMFNRLIESCHKKCISSYQEGDLTKQEGLCLDRCVYKYFEVNAKVGELMQNMGQQQFQKR